MLRAAGFGEGSSATAAGGYLAASGVGVGADVVVTANDVLGASDFVASSAGSTSIVAMQPERENHDGSSVAEVLVSADGLSTGVVTTMEGMIGPGFSAATDVFGTSDLVSHKVVLRDGGTTAGGNVDDSGVVIVAGTPIDGGLVPVTGACGVANTGDRDAALGVEAGSRPLIATDGVILAGTVMARRSMCRGRQ